MAKLQIDGKDYLVPAITLGQLRKTLKAKIEEHDKIALESRVFDALDKRAEIICDVMTAKYPELTQDQILDVLDMQNTGEIWLAMLGASGFKPGEVPAAESGT